MGDLLVRGWSVVVDLGAFRYKTFKGQSLEDVVLQAKAWRVEHPEYFMGSSTTTPSPTVKPKLRLRLVDRR